MAAAHNVHNRLSAHADRFGPATPRIEGETVHETEGPSTAIPYLMGGADLVAEYSAALPAWQESTPLGLMVGRVGVLIMSRVERSRIRSTALFWRRKVVVAPLRLGVSNSRLLVTRMGRHRGC